jgi:exonuclease SbcD
MSVSVIHTADWHLGQELHGFGREAEHEAFLAWLLDQIVEREADALVVAGDIFDTVNPAVSAQRRLYGFLRDVCERAPGIEIIMVGGNHDSAARLELPVPLLDKGRVRMLGGMPRSDGKPAPEQVLFPLHDKDGKPAVLCAAVPYLRPGDLPVSEKGPMDGLKKLYAQVLEAAESAREDMGLLVMGHLHMRGGKVSELSERKILIGGEHAVSDDIFPKSVDYVALGHLHRPQTVAKRDNVRYSGSPFPMSVTERDYRHSVSVVEFNGGGVKEIKTLDIPRLVDFLRIPEKGSKPLDDVVVALEELDLEDPGLDRRPFLEVVVSISTSEPDMRARIDAALEGKPVRLTRTQIVRETQGDGESLADGTDADVTLDELDPNSVFALRHKEEYGRVPTKELKTAFNEILEQVLNPGDETGENK